VKAQSEASFGSEIVASLKQLWRCVRHVQVTLTDDPEYSRKVASQGKGYRPAFTSGRLRLSPTGRSRVLTPIKWHLSLSIKSFIRGTILGGGILRKKAERRGSAVVGILGRTDIKLD
jgi:hypothetical protein